MAVMRCIQIGAAKGNFEMVERPIPDPGPRDVRIKVEACGVCHSDMFVKEGLFPGIQYPRIPGHEVIGIVDGIGSMVKGFKPGQRVGLGWHGGQCFVCDSCRHGDFITCANQLITGISYDGGYAEYVIAPQEALALAPDAMDPADAAPLMCAGVTTYNALRHSGAVAGDLVAVQGLGGLGHLGVEFARAMGFHTVAISSGQAKRELAAKLGAHAYIDTSTQSPANELKAMGGAKVILATAPNAKAMQPLIEGLGVGGKLMIVGADAQPISVSPLQLIGQRKSIMGWPSGDGMDSQETLKFAALSNIRPMIERFPLDRAAEAYEHMMRGSVRFRAVLTMS